MVILGNRSDFFLPRSKSYIGRYSFRLKNLYNWKKFIRLIWFKKTLIACDSLCNSCSLNWQYVTISWFSLFFLSCWATDLVDIVYLVWIYPAVFHKINLNPTKKNSLI